MKKRNAVLRNCLAPFLGSFVSGLWHFKSVAGIGLLGGGNMIVQLLTEQS